MSVLGHLGRRRGPVTVAVLGRRGRVADLVAARRLVLRPAR